MGFRHMKNLRIHHLAILIAISFTAQSASANSAHVLLCFPGGPGSTEQAQPIVDEFLAHLAVLAGWDNVKGTYINNMRECRAAMKTDTPATVVMVPLDLYLAERESWKLHASASLQNKETAGAYHLVALPGTTLEGLRDQPVQTGLKASDPFLTRVAFDGKVDVKTAFKLERTRSARKAVKNVVKQKTSAAILNDVQFNALQSSPKYSTLVSIVAGPTLPGAIVASVGSKSDTLTTALISVCKKHAEACKKMRITGFSDVDASTLSALEKKLNP